MDVFQDIRERLTGLGFEFESTDFERPWGGFFLINEKQSPTFLRTFFPDENPSTLTKGGRISPKILIVEPNKRLSWQYHHRRSEVWKVIRGEAGVVRSITDEQGTVERLRLGDKLIIQQGERHRLVGLDDYGVIAEIWQHTDDNNLSDEDDIVRLQDDFNRQ